MKKFTCSIFIILISIAFVSFLPACGKWYKHCTEDRPCPDGKICQDIGRRTTVCLNECDSGAADACGRNETCFRFAAGQSACAPTCNPDRRFPRACPDGWLCAPVAGPDSVCRPECNPAQGNASCATAEYCLDLGDGSGVCMPGCDPYSSEGCGAGQSCDLGPDGYSCYSAVYVEGRVFDSTDKSLGIVSAHVAAKDKTGAVATDVAVTGDNGTYRLQVPVERGDNGSLVEGTLTLRAEANDYQAYPSGIRPAIPIDAAQATQLDNGTYVLKNASTDIALIKLPASETGRKSISGSIILAGDNSTRPGGTLVVAEGGPCGLTCPFTFSDKKGDFTIFNVPAASWTIRGYKEFLQLTPAAVTHTASENLTGVSLVENDKPYGTVAGSANIVNPGDGDNTTVVLVPVSTFSSTFVKGEVPPGLRAPKQPAPPSIKGPFSITGVPDGYYVVLAAFENDFLVRDPDTSIAGTDLVYQHVPDNATSSYTINLPTSFKVTGALTIVSPGATGPELINPASLQLVWKDDSSEKHYLIVVYNAYGEKVLDCEIPGETGGNVTYDYNGGIGTCSTPAQTLDPGMYYQFRVQSTDASLVPKSQTEDLLGVFYTPE